MTANEPTQEFNQLVAEELMHYSRSDPGSSQNMFRAYYQRHRLRTFAQGNVSAADCERHALKLVRRKDPTYASDRVLSRFGHLR
jgi:hypothetical protein